MSSNKRIKEIMMKKYGKICMMEEAGIRCIPVEERRDLRGYKRSDESITYHHIVPKCKRRTSNGRKWSIAKIVQSSVVRKNRQSNARENKQTATRV